MDKQEQIKQIALGTLNLVEIMLNSSFGSEDDDTTAFLFGAEGSFITDLGAVEVTRRADGSQDVNATNFANAVVVLVGAVLGSAADRGLDVRELLEDTRARLET